MVKLEEPLDQLSSRMMFAQENASSEPPVLVNPGDLVTQPQPDYHDHRAYSTSPSFKAEMDFEENDTRYSVNSHRQVQQRSCSSDEDESSVPRRRFTKPENASCACDHCGKLFQRSYNLKAHLETHDPHRSHPHDCPYPECDKRFVRRTDLLRHEQSVRTLRVRPTIIAAKADSLVTGAPENARSSVSPLQQLFRSKGYLEKVRLGSDSECVLTINGQYRHVDDGCPKRTEVRKRVTKAGDPWSASSSRRPSFQDMR